jgi:hypothetical protein
MAYFSKTIFKAEMIYNVTQRELLAIEKNTEHLHILFCKQESRLHTSQPPLTL